MTLPIRRLQPGDKAILELLAREEADFDLEGRGEPLQPLSAEAARRYLENPAVLHWVAVEGEEVLGHLYCMLLPLRSGAGQELLLYEIGVRTSQRGKGTGRALLSHMESWMRENGLEEVWVLADNQNAVEFYRACGFSAETPQPLYMVRGLP